MNRFELIEQIKKTKSFLCIGLDPDLSKFPPHLLACEDPIFEFNKAIIDATKDFCVAYKPNTAFYEAYGVKGWISFEKTVQYIPKDKFIIADAKRGDIGNTSTQYAKAFFEAFPCDAVTVAPYMGEDSVKPFLQFKDKWAIVLGLTSNAGNIDFQIIKNEFEESNYETVLKRVSSWGSADNTMFVVGATNPTYFASIRKIIPDHFLLVPGIGAQGGSLQEVCKNGLNSDIGLLVNSARDIIYASKEADFAQRAGEKAYALQVEMSQWL